MGPKTPAAVEERRTLCLLCDGRCDPHAWTCHACHRRVIQAGTEREIEAALEEAALSQK